MTLTLDRVIRYTVMHHSSTSTYIPNFIGIGKTFCGRTDVRTDGHSEPHIEIIRLTLRSRPKKTQKAKPKETGPSLSVKTAHTNGYIITGYNCGTEQFWYLPSYPPDSHHSSDIVCVSCLRSSGVRHLHLYLPVLIHLRAWTCLSINWHFL